MAAVLAPLQNLSLDNGIMAPSPLSPNSSRHGRRSSVAKNNKPRGRGYSIVDERDAMISKALTWVLKRTIEKGEEQEEGEEKLVADSEGWVSCSEVLSRPQLSNIEVTFPEVQSLIASPSSKSKFGLKLKTPSEEETEDASAYLIRINPTVTPQTPTSTTPLKLTPLTTTTEDLPTLIAYETSYANYPLILASGGIKRAGGQAYLSFNPVESTVPATSADVSIFIDLRAAMEADSKISWQRSESGVIVTEGDKNGELSKAFWKKVVARRADIGVLFEDGEVRKEVPVGLRGKGTKPKKGGKGRGKGTKELKGRSEDEETNSD